MNKNNGNRSSIYITNLDKSMKFNEIHKKLIVYAALDGLFQRYHSQLSKTNLLIGQN